jgi:phosphoribosylanthranilate isomerase
MSGPLKIKVCGMKEPDNLQEVCGLGPDFVGYIFFRASLRYVGEKPDEALFSIPGDTVSRVGVFVNEPLLSIRNIVESGWVDVVQLHGSETPVYCKALVNEGIHVIKAIGPKHLDAIERLEDYNGVVHYFLFDTAGEGSGGSGEKFDWALLKKYTLPIPFLLSGGIGPGDAFSIRELDHLLLRGVDVNSRFEEAPGRKNISALKGFIKEIRK